LDAEPLWLTSEDVYAIHHEQLRLFGGLSGVKDDNLVGSALTAPVHLYIYEEQHDVLTLAVKLCHALVKNHGFVDGNKRTATAAMIEFLAINGYDLFVPDDKAEAPVLGVWVEKLVQGQLTPEQLCDRLKHFLRSAG
jgi:death-on-curing protein